MDKNENTTTTPDERARALVLEALWSFGEPAMELAEQARALVGIEGLERIGVDLANENRMEESYGLRGALDALAGLDEPEESTTYRDEAREGFDHVSGGGFHGAWS